MSFKSWGGSKKNKSSSADDSRGTYYPHQTQQHDTLYQPQAVNPYANTATGSAAPNPYAGGAGGSLSVGSASAANMARRPSPNPRGPQEHASQFQRYQSPPPQAAQQHHQHYSQPQYPQQQRFQQQQSPPPQQPRFQPPRAGSVGTGPDINSSYNFNNAVNAGSALRTYTPTPPPPPGTGPDAGGGAWMSRNSSASSLSPRTSQFEQQQQPPAPVPSEQVRAQQEPSSGGLFSRFRSGLSSISSATQKVLSREADGDTDDDTLVAAALVRYYSEHGSGVIPPWLATVKAARSHNAKMGGATVSNAVGGGASSLPASFSAPSAGAPGSNEVYYPHQHQQRAYSTATGAGRYGGAGASQLQDIYRKASAVEAATHADEFASGGSVSGPAGRAASSPTASAGYQYKSWGGRNTQAPAENASAHRFRDRLKSARPSLDESDTRPSYMR